MLKQSLISVFRDYRRDYDKDLEEHIMTDTKHEINYNELVNPTFTTGQATLEMLMSSGKISNRLCLSYILSRQQG